MCRISALTDSSINLKDRGLLFHDLMLRSNANDQNDGWGVYTGWNYWKNAGNYWPERIEWLHALVNNELKNPNEHILLGHVRAASAGTAKTTHEAHPFLMSHSIEKDGHTLHKTQFIAVHNGYFDGSYNGYKYVQGDPSSDSYRAFKKLSDMIGENRRLLTAELVDEWIANYESASVFALAFVIEGKLQLLRNTGRPLHWVKVGNGFMINTLKPILEATAHYANILGYETSPVEEIPNDQLITITPGSHEYESETLKLELKPSKYKSTYTSGTYSGNYYANAQQTAVTTPTATNNNTVTLGGIELANNDKHYKKRKHKDRNRNQDKQIVSVARDQYEEDEDYRNRAFVPRTTNPELRKAIIEIHDRADDEYWELYAFARGGERLPLREDFIKLRIFQYIADKVKPLSVALITMWLLSYFDDTDGDLDKMLSSYGDEFVTNMSWTQFYTEELIIFYLYISSLNLNMDELAKKVEPWTNIFGERQQEDFKIKPNYNSTRYRELAQELDMYIKYFGTVFIHNYSCDFIESMCEYIAYELRLMYTSAGQD